MFGFIVVAPRTAFLRILIDSMSSWKWKSGTNQNLLRLLPAAGMEKNKNKNMTARTNGQIWLYYTVKYYPLVSHHASVNGSANEGRVWEYLLHFFL